jgi:tRNA dimethylallyltransferase
VGVGHPAQPLELPAREPPRPGGEQVGQGGRDQLFSDRMRLPTLLVAVERPRPVLDALIARRVRRELDEGLVAELEAALDTPGVAREPLQIIGAREVAAVRAGDVPTAALPDLLAARTRRLARRQLQWLRRMPHAHVVDLGEGPAVDGLDAVLALWRAAGGRGG